MTAAITDARVLVVDDDPDVLSAARLLLKRRFAGVVTVNTPDAIPKLLAQPPGFDVVLLDLNFRRGDDTGAQGLEWVARLADLDPQAAIICVTAHGDIDVAVEAMRRGAVDFVIKPWENEKLIATVAAAARLRRTAEEVVEQRRRARELGGGPHAVPALDSQSPTFRAVLDIARQVAPTEATVLILGENGVGKEVLAREMHRLSARAHEPFVVVDLGAVPEPLAESELFGHRKGAFTDAKEDRAGRVAAADGGTLFMDEVANASLGLQAKLLSMLERREVLAVGDDRPRPVDVRVIAATNADAETLADPNRFRQDLRFRLNTVEIRVPPLRERREDLPALAASFAVESARKYAKPARPISQDAMDALLAHDWPGNVRALSHAVERAVILAPGDQLEAADFGAPFTPGADAVAPPSTLHAAERELIDAALRRHQGNVTRAALELGLTRTSLYRRMEKHGL